MTVVADKARLRDQIKGRRADLDPQVRRRASRAIFDRLMATRWLQTGRVIFTYISVDPEVETHSLTEVLEAEGRVVLVPRIVPGGTDMVAVRFPGWGELRPGPLGIPAPTDTTPYADRIDTVIVPGLAFTEAGDRLGYGRGYYDRWLRQHPECCRIAVAFDAQIVPVLPTEAHDLKVDIIVTENRWTGPRASEFSAETHPRTMS